MLVGGNVPSKAACVTESLVFGKICLSTLQFLGQSLMPLSPTGHAMVTLRPTQPRNSQPRRLALRNQNELTCCLVPFLKRRFEVTKLLRAGGDQQNALPTEVPARYFER